MLWVKTFFGILFQTALLGVFLYLPALTLNWADALLLLSIHFLITILASAYLLIVKPASIEARMNYDSEAQPKEDRLATVLMLSAIVVGLSLAPIDIFHLNLSSTFEGSIKNIGLGFYFIGMLLFMASMNANEFAETTVNIQEERGQKVIDTGIYSKVRHPMYTGFIFF
ncbi:MAG: hypothetical protein VW059_04410, partial [Gammaproteobacteria bacterium]